MISTADHPAEAVYRIVSFQVPASARTEFLERTATVQALLRRQPGFLGDQVFEQAAGPGRFNLVAVAIWADQAAVEAASRAIAAREAETGLDRAAFVARAGITVETGMFRTLSL